MILRLQALLEHLKLKHTHDAHDDALHAGAHLAEDLHGAFLRKLLHALDELLALEGVYLGDSCEVLRGEGRHLGILHALLARTHGVAHREDARVEEAHDVAGIGLVHRGAVIGHEGRARGELELAVALHVPGVHAALKTTRADTHESDAVAVVLVHVGLDLEHEAREVLARRWHQLAGKLVGVRLGARRQAKELAQERLDAEVGEGAAEEDGRELAVRHGVEVELVTGAVEQLDVVHKVAVVLGTDKVVKRGVAQLGLDLGNLLGGVGVARAFKREHMTALAIEHATEVAAVADGPVHGIGADAQHRLDLLHELERVAALMVELVDEGEDRDVAQGTHTEQLLGLRLDALCSVDHHDCRVGSHERAVRVLGKVLVTRGVEDVDANTVVVELQDRGGDGNAARLLDVHPVGHRMLGRALALDRAGRLNAARVQQELLGKGGLTCVGVRNDGKSATRGDFVGQARHGGPFLQRRARPSYTVRFSQTVYCSAKKELAMSW